MTFYIQELWKNLRERSFGPRDHVLNEKLCYKDVRPPGAHAAPRAYAS